MKSEIPMDNKRTYCEDCGHEVASNWLFCVRCGNNITSSHQIVCSKCFHIIDDPSPNFCPFCKSRIEKSQLSTALEKEPVPRYQKKEAVFETQEKKPVQQLSIKSIISSYKLETTAMERIVGDKSFNLHAIILIALTAISYIITDTIFYSVLYNSSLEEGVYLESATVQISLLLMTGIFSNLITSIIREEDNNHNFLRLVGSYAILFILKDMLMILLIFYINFFQPGPAGYVIASNLSMSASVTLFMFLFVYVTVFTKHITKTTTSVSIFLVFIVFIMSIAFTSSFIVPSIRVAQTLIGL